MYKGKILFIGASAAAMTAAIATPAALADNVIPNDPATAIPISQIVNAGTSVDMTDITYTISVSSKSYTGATDTGVYAFNGTITNQPIVIKPSDVANTTGNVAGVGDDSKVWDYTRTLAQLFGADPSDNFDQAGMYEFTINSAASGGSAGIASMWSYDNPEYLLQVLVKNTTSNGEITGLAYDGWTLSKWDESANSGAGAYVKVNSGSSSENGSAEFEATYTAKSTLSVSKKVSGDYASTTYAFPVTITMELPSWYDQTASGNAISALSESTATSCVKDTTASSGNTLVFNTTLKHDEAVLFNVPVGTVYQVVEDPSHDTIYDAVGIEYEPSIEWNVDTEKDVIHVRYLAYFGGDRSYEIVHEADCLASDTFVPYTANFYPGHQVSYCHTGLMYIEGSEDAIPGVLGYLADDNTTFGELYATNTRMEFDETIGDYVTDDETGLYTVLEPNGTLDIMEEMTECVYSVHYNVNEPAGTPTIGIGSNNNTIDYYWDGRPYVGPDVRGYDMSYIGTSSTRSGGFQISNNTTIEELWTALGMDSTDYTYLDSDPENYNSSNVVEVYFDWTPVDYTLIYNLGDHGTGAIANATVHWFSETDDIMPAAPASDDPNWVFDGWYDERNQLVTTGLNFSNFATSEDESVTTTWTAHWRHV